MGNFTDTCKTPVHCALSAAAKAALAAWRFGGAIVVAMGLCLLVVAPAFGSCASPKNPIEAENCLPGTPSVQWQPVGAGGSTIQGFTTDMSVNLGQTVFFKVVTDAAAYRIDIYRIGYYQGNGARLVASISPSATLPQTQPPCMTDSSTGLTDCGNWGVSASWLVPGTAVSGVYLGRLVRPDTGAANNILFVVRNDSSHSDILLQTSDTSWQAYNNYGGNSLYTGSPAGRAYKVSYNRPITTTNDYTVFTSAEYPMIRWLEANGYDVSYFSGMDTDRNGGLITQHKAFFSVGHDEYWSGGQRANVEGARAAGMHLAFFSGNEIFWKTRWEPSIDGSATPYRTLVSYKETAAGKVIDPADPPTWTGTWRDPRFSPPADGGRPENALSGTLSMVNSLRTDSITVPQADGRMRFWRNTSIAALGPGQVATLPPGTLGYEWDINPDNGFRPPGLVPLSTTTLDIVSQYLLDYGSTYGNGTATHQLTLYRVPSGALVFGAGTVQWSWGLDATHDNAGTPTDPNMQQATVNLLADMNLQPATLQSGLVAATPSTDTAPPLSTITVPVPGGIVPASSLVTISGTAQDLGGGVVGLVEVSFDGGLTWHPTAGRESWSYTTTFIHAGPLTIRSRATDDSGNQETPGPGIAITVTCPCTIWPATAAPLNRDKGADSPVELGVKFQSDNNGSITGLRFYKSAANTGAHVANLWSSSGTLLGTATFTSETASGWQQVNFPSPIPIAANTVYVASYHTNVGHYSADWSYFASAGVDNAPLHALSNAAGGGNGVYLYGSTSGFPTYTFSSANYWVDVVFDNTAIPLSVSTSSLPNGTQTIAYSQTLAATGGTAPYSWVLVAGSLPAGLTLSSSGQISGTPTSAGTNSFTVQVTDASNPAQKAAAVLSLVVDGVAGDTIWPGSTVPSVIDKGADSAVELGVKFQSDSSGYIAGIRFYKSAANTGTHVGNLWSSSGTLLGSVTFSGETASGWQQANFTSPIAITANTVYVASYHTNVGHFSVNWSYFAGGVNFDNPPLHALGDGVSGGDGVYTYSAASAFPVNTYQSANYWVDVLFNATAVPDFAIVASPSSQTVTAGSGTTYSATVTAVSGFAGVVNLTVSGLPPGAIASPSPAPVTGSGAATLSVTTGSSTPAGTYTLTVTGTSGSLVHSTTVILVVTGAPDFTIGVSPSPQSVVAGSGMSYTTTVAALNGFASTVNVTLSGLPAAASGSFSPTSVAGSGTATLSVTCGSSTPAGTYTLTITGISGALVHSTTVTLVVTGATDFTISASPASQTVVAGSGTSYTATITALNGFGGAVNITASGLPAAASGSFSPTSVSGSGTATLSVTTASSTPVGTYTLTLTGTSGSLAHSTSVMLVISPATSDFTIGASPNSQTVVAGSGTAYSITVAALNGFGGAVNFTVSGMPATASGSFNPTSVAGSGAATVSVTTASSTPPGVYPLTITGTSGSVVHSVPVTLVVATQNGSTIWPATATPAIVDKGADSAVELGVKFRTDSNGYITGIRFYKSAANTGTHVGNLWSSSGTLLGSVTFSGETASGWQQANFSSPIPITANSVYVASYHTNVGHFSVDWSYFASTGVDNIPLHAQSNATGGGNGVYMYGAASAFPTNTYSSANYWVDLVFNELVSSPDFTMAASPSSPAVTVGAGTSIACTVTALNGFAGTVSLGVSGLPAGATASFSPTSVSAAGSSTLSLTTSGSTPPGTYSLTVTGTSGSLVYSAPLTLIVVRSGGLTIWPSTVIPAIADSTQTQPVELGVKFSSDSSGTITGIRFYKSAGNTGTHVGNLWSSSGTLLGTATFSGKSASGWQQVNFSSPIPITANTVYVASYFTSTGHFSVDWNYFATAGVDNVPLHGLSNGVGGGNGVYVYSSTSAFPTNTYSSANYWVDVMFQ